MLPVIKIKSLHPKAELPTKAHQTDACFDVVATSRGELKDGLITYGLGFATELPKGWAAFIYPRSSIRTTDLLLANGVGVIDADYRGEWQMTFRVVKQESGLGMLGAMLEGTKVYEVGSRIGQVEFRKLDKHLFDVVEELTDTTRGAGGFGSTGS